MHTRVVFIRTDWANTAASQIIPAQSVLAFSENRKRSFNPVTANKRGARVTLAVIISSHVLTNCQHAATESVTYST